MAKQISAINGETVHRICSGQVILNLAVAIKELIENSLDAGATAVEIRLKEYGSEMIEVCDNGKGVHPDDFEALALKHHTSKLRDFHDLVEVETFGFRGEALSSLCALSDMVVTTKYIDEQCGAKLIFNKHGVLSKKQAFPRQTGTTVTLSNLFAALPVRQKNFKENIKKEFAKAVQLLSAYCLISEKVKITCSNHLKKSGKTIFLATQENKSIRDNISCVFGPKQLNNLLEVDNTHLSKDVLEEYGLEDAKSDMFRINGFVSSCEHGRGRGTTDRQFFYINSRPFEHAKISKLTNEIYHHYNLHQNPFILLNIIVSKESVDINVSPDKRQIYIENEKLLLACIKSTLINLYEKIPSTYRLIAPEGIIPQGNRSEENTNELDKTSNLQQPSKNSMNSLLLRLKRKQEHILKEDKLCKQQKMSNFFSQINEPKKVQESEESYSCKENEINKDRIISELHTTSFTNINDQEDQDETQSYLSRNNNVSKQLQEVKIIIEDSISKSKDDISDPCDSNNANALIKQQETNVEISNNLSNVEKIQKSVLSVDIESIKQAIVAKRMRPKNDDFHNRFHAEIDPTQTESAENELAKEISKNMFPEMKIIGQFNLGFIITKLNNDLFIVDQHATDEKYNFETLEKSTTLKNQKLIIPQDLNLTASNENVLIQNLEILQKNGFEFAIDSSAEVTKKVKLLSIPVSQNWQFGKDDIDELLFMLQDSPNTVCRPSRIRAMFASRACRKSVMIGTALSIHDMRRLINNMAVIDQPWNCPHGRPTMRHMVNLSLLQ